MWKHCEMDWNKDFHCLVDALFFQVTNFHFSVAELHASF